MGLPSPDSLSLSQSVDFVIKRCNCSNNEAKRALQRAGLDGRLDAFGMVPSTTHPNPAFREAYPVRTRRSLTPGDWASEIDWDTGKVGPYFSVSITRLSIEAWLDAGREAPSAPIASEDELRKAPEAVIHGTIREVYDDAERAHQKPPNVIEIIKLVKGKLHDKGFKASGRHIRQLADDKEHQKRRRKPGATVASEKHRQDR
jgi:hypothetical protein